MFRIATVALFAAAASLARPSATAQDQSATVSDADKQAAAAEFDAVEKAAKGLFVKCPECRGRGKVKGKTCPTCLGHRKVFAGDYQELLDGYVEYCDLIDKHADVLKADPEFSKRVHETRDWYCNVIGHELGPQTDRPQLNRGRTARYGRGTKRDGQCDRLAFEALVGDKPPVNKALAFEGRVARILTKDNQAIAEVRFSVGTFRSRTCWVLVPPDVRWKDYGQVRVIGKAVPAPRQRKRFNLGADVVIVKPYPGTR